MGDLDSDRHISHRLLIINDSLFMTHTKVLYFYLDEKDVGCPKQSISFIFKITCPNKKLLYDYANTIYSLANNL